MNPKTRPPERDERPGGNHEPDSNSSADESTTVKSSISQAEQAASPQITFLATKYIPSPESDNFVGRTADAAGIPLAEALARQWPTDAHITAYAPVTIEGVGPLRLASGALGEGVPVCMVALIGDIDGADHKATDEWRAETLPKIEASGLAYYSTRGGYRVLATLAEPITLTEPSDAVDWTRLYQGWADLLEAEHGLKIDPACKDWTRPFRLPNVRRESIGDVSAPVVGDIPAIDWRSITPRPGSTAERTAKPEPQGGEPEVVEPLIQELADAIEEVWNEGTPSKPAHNGFRLLFLGWLAGKGWSLDERAALIETLAASLGATPALVRQYLSDNRRADPLPGPGDMVRQHFGGSFDAVDRIVNKHPGAAPKVDPAMAKRADEKAAKREARAEKPPTIVGDARGSQFWLAHDDDTNTYFAPVAKGMLPARYREATGESAAQKADHLAAQATIADAIVRDFSAGGIVWREPREVVQGYSLPRIEPVYDAQVDAWLRTLAGDRYPRLVEWLAACKQEHIASLAACLVLLGDTGIGKTLIALLAARIWGVNSPVKLAHVVDRFNASVVRCPVVLDDEAAYLKKGEMSTADFREMLAAREREYEPKGVDRRVLRGCQRFVVTGNAPEDLRFTDVGAGKIVEALADRLLVIRCGNARESLSPLRIPSSDDADMPRLDRHVAWLLSKTTPTAQRFLASPGYADPEAQAAILSGIRTRHPALFDRLREALDSPEVVLDSPEVVPNEGKSKRGFLAKNPPAVTLPEVFLAGGVLWVRLEALATLLGPRERSDQIAAALAPWETGSTHVKVGGKSHRARGYDLEKLKAFLA